MSGAASGQPAEPSHPASGSTRRDKRILIAFDKFKDALSASEACELVATRIAKARPHWQLDLAPLTDGGEDFCRTLTRAAGGRFSSATLPGPRFDLRSRARDGALRAAPSQSLQAPIGLVSLDQLSSNARRRLELGCNFGAGEEVAVIDMASVNGLALVPANRRNPWLASSYGTGLLIAAAARSGASAIVLGVGGSATSDLGTGALSALGLRFEDAQGRELCPPLPALWERMVRVGGRVRAALPPLRIACDVQNPLFGPRGAAAVYGPQKGLQPSDVPRLEEQAKRIAGSLCEHLGCSWTHAKRPGAGAAGGIAFGLMLATGAKRISGAQLAIDWLGLADRACQADWILTGEGRFDRSSHEGKGPGAIVRLARQCQRSYQVWAGSVSAELAGQPGLQAISPMNQPLRAALAATRSNLRKAVETWLERVVD